MLLVYAVAVVAGLVLAPWAVAEGWPLFILIPGLWALVIHAIIHTRKDRHP